MSKTGKQAVYIDFGNETAQETVNGHVLGVSYNSHNKTYYTMIPKALLNGAQRSKLQWLGSDRLKAVAKFRAIIDGLRGKAEKLVKTPIYFGTGKTLSVFIPKSEELKKLKPFSEFVPEHVYIAWLKKELENPKELARKTGIVEFMDFGKLLAKDKNIQLEDLLNNYLNKKKTISPKEAYNTKLYFNTFADVMNCKTVEQITLKDILKYEDYLHSQNLSAKSIIQRIGKITTIFRYNTGRYNSQDIIQIYNWLRVLDRPTDEKPFMPVLMSPKDFNALYEVADNKWKLILLLSLNCALYPIDITRLKVDSINQDDYTLAYRRGKTGKVLAISCLWNRTIELLKEYLATRKGNSEYLFITKYGAQYKPKGILEHFNILKEKIGLNGSVKFSHLRDTFATLAQDKGFSIEQINLVLGHKNRGMNDRYAVRRTTELTKQLCLSVEKAFFEK